MKIKSIRAIFLVPLMLPLLTGCANNTENEGVIETGQFDIWSTYSTTKVMSNINAIMPYEKLAASINVDMMRGEKESTQLIITAKRDISCYTLVKTDLKDNFGHTLPKEDISLFAQKYINLKRKFNLSNELIEAGDRIPDMLLPLNKSIEYHENFIKKDTNQGITIDVKTYSDTAPGVYTGTFKLYLDDEVVDIPVKVNVWDIDGSGKHDFKSCFLVYQNYLPAGEYSNTDELLDRYNKTLIDYQVCFEIINDEDKTDEGIKEYLDYCFSFLSYDEYNSINIPLWFEFGNPSNIYDFDYALENPGSTAGICLDNMYRYFKYLLEKTTEENHYIDYTYWYASCLDEADANSALLPRAIAFFKKGGDWEKSLNYVANKLETEGVLNSFSPVFKEHIVDYINHFPAVYTNTQFGSSIENNLTATLCPLISIFNSDSNVNQLQNYATSKTNDNLWTYTCSGPTNPYPTLHIDDFNLGTRVAGWMFKKYKINGYLYWAVDLYQSLKVFGSLDTVVDPYADVERAGKVPGDGFLLYPGKYYGSEYPFPSTRLMMYRDSIEDYILLSRYEQALQKYSRKYGIDINFDNFVTDLYDSLFSGTIYIKDDELVFKARNELAKRILALENDDHMIINKTSTIIGTNFDVYCECPSLILNNETIRGTKNGDSYSYHFENLQGDIVIETEQHKYTYLLTAKGYLLDFSNKDSVKYFKNENSTIEFVDDSAHIKLVSEYRGEEGEIDGATKIFRPYVEFNINSLEDMINLQFNLTNNTDAMLEANIELIDADGNAEKISTISAYALTETNIKVNLLSIDKKVLSDAVKLRISVKNVYSEGGIYHLCDPSDFTISSVAFEK